VRGEKIKMRRKKKKMINKKSEIRSSKFLLIGIMLLIFITLLVQAQGEESNESLQAELSNLTAYLDEQSYLWLVNYSLDGSVDIEVYREDGDEVIAVIEGVRGEDWYKTYLDGLHGGVGLDDNESLSVFDLKVNEIKIPYNIYQKKKRIDEIRRILFSLWNSLSIQFLFLICLKKLNIRRLLG